MKVILLTGSHPRHLYVAGSLLNAGRLNGVLIEQREAFVPIPPDGLMEIDRMNFNRHFRERSDTEALFFGATGEQVLVDIPSIRVERDELNSDTVRRWVSGIEPDVVITYGVHKINDQLLSGFPTNRWNVHGGLSPWFRGNATLFWPFYFLRPNWAGMTLHYLSAHIDHGDIIHHSIPALENGHGIHDVACKAVQQMAVDLVKVLDLVEKGVKLPRKPQTNVGKLFTSADWTPHTLRLIYNTFNNDIVDRYLAGELLAPNPPLVDALGRYEGRA